MTKLNKVVVFDVDGTLANCEHRLHYIREKPKNFPKFMSGMALDTPYEDMCWFATHLHWNPYPVVIATGRNEKYRELTNSWLLTNGVRFLKLYMRADDDYRPDYVTKAEYIEKMALDGFVPFVVFEDRDSVVQMWRANGIRCLQVQPGS